MCSKYREPRLSIFTLSRDHSHICAAIAQGWVNSHDNVSTVTLFVYGNFVGFDAVLGQSWLIQHDVVLEMGSGRIIVPEGARKHYLSSISK